MAAPTTLTFPGRSRERAELDRALAGVRAGDSAVLVLRGEAGIGKTTLLEYLGEQASGCRVIKVTGAESELELPFAALHQLCAPVLGGLPSLPPPQAQALQVAFGSTAGPAPDRFVVGVAVLSLLAEATAERPLVCLVDDAQWLDEASRQVLGFVGRRLLAESVLLVFAVRTPADQGLLAGMPELALDGLIDEEAAALLAAAIPGHLDPQVRDRIVAETRGNPLALLELARRNRAELLGGFALPPAGHVPGQLQDLFIRRINELPAPTRQLMLLAAADPTGDATLLWRTATSLGLGPTAAAPAEDEQLLTIDARVRFRHPLVRSAAYAAGSDQDRRSAHLALAAAIDAETEPDRRVWHLAAAAAGPDEDVAAELERAALRAEARGGMPAAAAFLQRSVALTADPGQRAERALAAAHAQLHAGDFDAALGLLAQAQADATDDLQRARVDLLRGQVGRAANSGRDAPGQLLRAARRLEPLDIRLARDTYLDTWSAALVAGRLAPPEGSLLEVSRAAQSVPAASPDPQPGDLLLDGLATMITEGAAAAAPSLRRAVDAFLGDQVPADQWLDWGVLAATGHHRERSALPRRGSRPANDRPGQRPAAQRSRSLRAGVRRGGTRGTGQPRPVHRTSTARPDRGRCPQRAPRKRGRGTATAHRIHHRSRLRLGSGPAGTLTGFAQRRSRGRGVLRPGGRAIEPDPAPIGTRPYPPAVRRVAPPRATTVRCAGRTARRIRGVRLDGRRRLRRPIPSRAARHRRKGP